MCFKTLPVSQAGLDAMPPGGTDELRTGLMFPEAELFLEIPNFNHSITLLNKFLSHS